jgi:hypothetical protein
MTEDVKKLVESVEVYSKIAEPNGSYVLKSEFLRVVKELTKWNKVEDGVPDVQKRNTDRYVFTDGYRFEVVEIFTSEIRDYVKSCFTMWRSI